MTGTATHFPKSPSNHGNHVLLERARSIIDIVEAGLRKFPAVDNQAYTCSRALDSPSTAPRKADVAWKDAKVGYVAQVVAWYLVCQNIKFYLCPRKELKSDTEDETFAKFKGEMESVPCWTITLCGSPANHS